VAIEQVKAEQKEELAEFDENISWEEGERREEESHIEQELAMLDKEVGWMLGFYYFCFVIVWWASDIDWTFINYWLKFNTDCENVMGDILKFSPYLTTFNLKVILNHVFLLLIHGD